MYKSQKELFLMRKKIKHLRSYEFSLEEESTKRYRTFEVDGSRITARTRTFWGSCEDELGCAGSGTCWMRMGGVDLRRDSLCK